MNTNIKNRLFIYVLLLCFSVSFISAGMADETPLGLFIPKIPGTEIEYQLWQTDIGIPQGGSNKSKDRLQEIIRQVRAVEFKPPDQITEPLIDVESIENEANQTPAVLKISQKKEKQPQKIEANLGYEPVKTETIQIFEELSKESGRLINPFELGEILYRSGNLKEAALCYQQALADTDPNITTPENKDWILFQTANCLQENNSDAALQMYRRLINEYPDSPWAGLAKAKMQLIDWLLKDKPQTLIENGVSQT